jgi:hypothetical protein
MNTIIENSVAFKDKDFFGDNYEHEYFCRCHDGHAVCMNSVHSNAPGVINVKYPKLEELTKEQKDYILKYRGLADLNHCDIHYGDVMITYGEIEK